MKLATWFSECLRDPCLLKSVPQYAEHTPHARFLRALHDGSASNLDLAVLLRGILRYNSIEFGSRLELELPNSVAQLLRSSGPVVGLSISGETRCVFSAPPWQPSWLPVRFVQPVDSCYFPTARRPLEQVDGDPILHRLGYTNYTSNAQREALRAVLCSAVGDTLAICLPTGAGKTLCAFLPSLLPISADNTSQGVSVIVVPTVALALHLEQRLQPLVGHRTAYRPDIPGEAEAIRQRCAAGVQGPVFISPEALGGKEMRKSLRTAATKGYLRYFIIDEAHMVLSWGDEFRPAFLSLASIRRELSASHANKGLVTLLFSATLTDYHMRWLSELFAEPGRFRVVHAARLRPEPNFWMAKAPTEDLRTTWVEEAICNLPRPAIVYSTLRTTCFQWLNRLKAMGFRRIGHMDGETSDQSRLQLLKDWEQDNIDIVVATSAFGLGVDKPDIRSILHAELPESVDRFYQDVGRSGRDGCASVSLLVTTVGDWRKIGGMTQPRFISPALGLERWRRMFEARKPIGDNTGTFLVNLGVGRELDMGGDYNRNWNLRALQLLRRAGALDFIPSEENTFDEVAIRINPRPHTDPAYWHSEIDTLRQQIAGDYQQIRTLLKQLARIPTDQCLSKLFADCYASPTFGLTCVTACGGCPVCRMRQEPPRCGRIACLHVPDNPMPQRFGDMELNKLFSVGRTSLIHHRNPLDQTQVEEILWWFASRGVINFIIPPEHMDTLQAISDQAAQLIIFLHDHPPRELDIAALQPTLIWVTDPPQQWWRNFHATLPNRENLTIVIAPSDLRCPDDRGRLVRNVFPGQTMDFKFWQNQFVA